MTKIAKPVRPLGDVNVLPQKDGSAEVVVCFLPDPEMLVGEGNSKACLALDASVSMKKMYGFPGLFGAESPNYVQAVARKIGQILCGVTKSGYVNGIYWALGHDGAKIEEIGTYDEDGWLSALTPGPKKEKMGKSTKLLPTLKHVVETVGKDSDFTFGVVISDGIIEDEADSVAYCLKVGKEMATGKRKPVKIILFGIGEEIDEDQLERFDDMFEGSGIDYDLFSHGLVPSIQDESDIIAILFSELVDEDTPVAPSGKVEDSKGRVLATYKDGLPGKLRFIVPKGESKFVIRTPSNAIEQDISEVVRNP